MIHIYTSALERINCRIAHCLMMTRIWEHDEPSTSARLTHLFYDMELTKAKRRKTRLERWRALKTVAG